jgi:hypothetical protein
MTWIQRGLLLVVLGLVGLFVRGRGDKSARTVASDGAVAASSQLAGAVFAAVVPVYPGATLEDVMGGSYQGEIDGPVTFRSRSWFFTISDPAPQVVQFYRRSLPQNTTPTDAGEGATGFEFVPVGAEAGERVTVVVEEGTLQIGETIRATRTP